MLKPQAGKPTKKKPGTAKPSAKTQRNFDPQSPENEIDFKKAYAKLATKISSQEDDEPKLLINENELRKIVKDQERIEERTEEISSFHEKIQNRQDKKKTKVESMKTELEKKQMAECTFAPKLTTQKETRQLEDFLRDQEKHLEKHKETVRRIAQENQEKEEKSIVSLPKINDNSKSIGNQGGKPVHERLYSKAKKEIEQPKPETKKSKVKEGNERQLTLYEEAKKRKERADERLKKEQEDLKNSKFSKGFAKDPYIKQKYSKEFNSILESLESDNPETFLTFDKMSNLNYINLAEVLNKMCFIKIKPLNEEEKSDVEKENSEDWPMKIWKILEGETRNGVNPENLKIFTGAIMKILICPEAKSESGHYGSFNDKGIFVLTQKQASKINKDEEDIVTLPDSVLNAIILRMPLSRTISLS